MTGFNADHTDYVQLDQWFVVNSAIQGTSSARGPPARERNVARRITSLRMLSYSSSHRDSVYLAEMITVQLI